MKTEIHISGQVSGNIHLTTAIVAAGNRIESVSMGMFYSKTIQFETKRAAKQALWKAFKSLCADKPSQRNKIGGIKYSSGSALYYDASKAVIQ